MRNPHRHSLRQNGQFWARLNCFRAHIDNSKFVLATSLERIINRDPNFIPNFPQGSWDPRTIRVDPITMGANDHHDHLEGSFGYPGPLTLPQNSIGSLRGDVRPD
ncbi:hypothetical protein CRG98_040739 [Punica granatum]|uniref:Uncharacterized protein n=1 Tax=Punica granatum TaxID=22663 RepID=A0A2I0I4H1_PUNGR|nr:hypothetical protein CRG98_040739 [Punica granatum]